MRTGFDLVREVLVHDLPPQLERRRQLAFLQ